MTDGPTPDTNKPVSPAGAARETTKAQSAVGAPTAKPRPRGMSYGGISAAQHALERLERATSQSKNGRRALA